MSQGSNFKKEVMEALSNAPTNLITSKAFMWAATNLPDEGGIGRFSKTARVFNHEVHSFWQAVGMNEETPERIHNHISDVAKAFVDNKQEGEGITRSMIFEEIENKCGQEGMMYLAMLGFNELHDRWTSDSSDKHEEFYKFLKWLKSKGGAL